MGIAGLDRRKFLKWAGALPGAQLIGAQIFTADSALAQEKIFRHGLSVFGDVKYPAGFKNYDYVNVNAPKGGKLRIGFVGSFDTINAYSIKGDPLAMGYGQIILADETEPLMEAAYDEPVTKYGLLADGIWYPEDYSRVSFHLNPLAKFHDGKPVTVEDVIWTLDILKVSLPTAQAYYKNVVKAEQTGEREVTFIFDAPGNRDLPSLMGVLPALPKHWWTGKDAQGKQRDITSNSLEPPLGSGPYRITDVRPGASARLERVKDYWGKDLPVNIGRHNFDEVEIVLYKDQIVAFEAFKAGEYDFRLESSAKQWATGYDFPALRNGRVTKTTERLQGVEQIQAWVLNLRREKFQDVRLRRALNLAFDFEWTKKNIFYGQYDRCRSIFNNSELEAKGLPSAEELLLLEPLRAELPAEVFTSEYVNPVSDTTQNRRKNMREASKLLDEAGWKITQDGTKSVRKNAKGETLELEFVLDSPLFERIALPYIQELQSLGITCSVKVIDAAQYERRVENRDYDIISAVWGQSMSPGSEQRDYWGTEAADKPGSRNYPGIKNKAIDTLIEKVVFAEDRAAQITASRALDRAVMSNHFFVPMWFGADERFAYWNRLGRPARTPEFVLGFASCWWFDDSKMPKG